MSGCCCHPSARCMATFAARRYDAVVTETVERMPEWRRWSDRDDVVEYDSLHTMRDDDALLEDVSRMYVGRCSSYVSLPGSALLCKWDDVALKSCASAEWWGRWRRRHEHCHGVQCSEEERE